MFDTPMTIEEARKYRYFQWSGNKNGTPYREGRCAYEVAGADRWISFHQCYRKNGHGPAGLYCKQHAKNGGARI